MHANDIGSFADDGVADEGFPLSPPVPAGEFDLDIVVMGVETSNCLDGPFMLAFDSTEFPQQNFCWTIGFGDVRAAGYKQAGCAEQHNCHYFVGYDSSFQRLSLWETDHIRGL